LQVAYVRGAHPALGVVKGECATIVETSDKLDTAHLVEPHRRPRLDQIRRSCMHAKSTQRRAATAPKPESALPTSQPCFSSPASSAVRWRPRRLVSPMSKNKETPPARRGDRIGQRRTAAADWPPGNRDRPLGQLKNLGPVTVRQLGAIGIGTETQLRAVGALEAYRRLRQAFPDRINLVALYSLQGALLDCPWGDLPTELREQLKAIAGGS
jgi:DNA transformation protein